MKTKDILWHLNLLIPLRRNYLKKFEEKGRLNLKIHVRYLATTNLISTIERIAISVEINVC